MTALRTAPPALEEREAPEKLPPTLTLAEADADADADADAGATIATTADDTPK